MKLAYLKCTVWRVLTVVYICVAISQSRYQLSPVHCYHTALSRYFTQQCRTLSSLFMFPPLQRKLPGTGLIHLVCSLLCSSWSRHPSCLHSTNEWPLPFVRARNPWLLMLQTRSRYSVGLGIALPLVELNSRCRFPRVGNTLSSWTCGNELFLLPCGLPHHFHTPHLPGLRVPSWNVMVRAIKHSPKAECIHVNLGTFG